MKTYRKTATLVGSAYLFSNITFIVGTIVMVESILGSPDYLNLMSAMRLGEDMIATTVCRHAVKANDPLHEKELQKLLEDLLVCDMAYCCPHGRPTLIQINYAELERKFGRRA